MTNIPSNEEAASEQADLIAEFRKGDKRDNAIADILECCTDENPCNLQRCYLCERRRDIAFHQLPASDLWATMLRPVRVPIAEMVIGKNVRPLDEQRVEQIMQSLLVVGQLSPVILWEYKKGRLRLVAGHHRSEAAKRLGWDSVLATVLHGDEIDERLCQVAENVCRADLRVLDWAEAIDDWRRYVAQKSKVGQSAPRGGFQAKDAYINKTARSLGLTKEQVRRAKRIAGLSDEAKAAARSLGLDDNKTALLEAQKQEEARAQVQVLQAYAERSRAAAAEVLNEGVSTPLKIDALRADVARDAESLGDMRRQLADKQKDLETLEDQRFKDLQSEQVETAVNRAAERPPLGMKEAVKLMALKRAWTQKGVLPREKWDDLRSATKIEFVSSVLMKPPS